MFLLNKGLRDSRLFRAFWHLAFRSGKFGGMTGNMESQKGYVDHIIYRNSDNGYTILALSCEKEDITCVGVFKDVDQENCWKYKETLCSIPYMESSLK